MERHSMSPEKYEDEKSRPVQTGMAMPMQQATMVPAAGMPMQQGTAMPMQQGMAMPVGATMPQAERQDRKITRAASAPKGSSVVPSPM